MRTQLTGLQNNNKATVFACTDCSATGGTILLFFWERSWKWIELLKAKVWIIVLFVQVYKRKEYPLHYKNVNVIVQDNSVLWFAIWVANDFCCKAE